MHPSWNEYPHLLAELDPNGNKGLTHRGKPVSVLELAAGTSKKLDWKCSTCEHEWSSTGNSRVKGRGCPACAGHSVHSDGRNSMAMTHPDLAIEYQGDATKIMAGTNKKLDWKCSTCEHEWKTKGYNRASHGSGCPFCNNGVLHSDGRNSMAQTHPDLALEYQGDATKIIVGTHKKLDWKCSSCEHEWKTTGDNRVSGNGCPACSGHSVHSDGRNSMAVTHPELAIEYQGDATQIVAGTNKKLDWKCSTCDHEWPAQGSNRVKGNGCSACATSGFKPNEPAHYYVHEILNESGEIIMYKAGISKDWQRRLSRLRTKLPDHLSIQNVDYLEFEVGQEAWDLEQRILKQAEAEGWKAPVRDFDGGTELFLYNPINFLNLRSENGS
jgi:Zn finger protein HypA/HybF involved in hydrogenase expression